MIEGRFVLTCDVCRNQVVITPDIAVSLQEYRVAEAVLYYADIPEGWHVCCTLTACRECLKARLEPAEDIRGQLDGGRTALW